MMHLGPISIEELLNPFATHHEIGVYILPKKEMYLQK